MADREKVIRGLECCAANACFECPYHNETECVDALTPDALALLKEQEEKIASLQTTINRLHEGIQKAVKWNA